LLDEQPILSMQELRISRKSLFLRLSRNRSFNGSAGPMQDEENAKADHTNGKQI